MVQISMAEIYVEKAYEICYWTYFKWVNETSWKTLRILNEANADLGLLLETFSGLTNQ